MRWEVSLYSSRGKFIAPCAHKVMFLHFRRVRTVAKSGGLLEKLIVCRLVRNFPTSNTDGSFITACIQTHPKLQHGISQGICIQHSEMLLSESLS
jgi:hypothetical protein